MHLRKFKLHTGQEIIIREAQHSDAQALLSLKLDYLKNTTTIPLFKDEYPDDLKSETQLIQRLEDEKNSVLVVAEHNNELIGNIDLNGNQRIKLFHTGVVGMGIKSDWRGCGIGTALLTYVIEWSRMNRFLKLIWLEVYQTNEAGLALYEKVGFNECGRIKDFFFENDTYIEKITMVKYLKS
ncbi:MAG: GNAT family N-acetyltransferase [Saprospiraceae bacterium]|nr:GNAT family N-acetyltransferase [Saprospiraceae bacterium]